MAQNEGDVPEISEQKRKVQVWLYAPAGEGAGGSAWRVLLLHTRPERGGFWQPVTGGVEAGESLLAAAEREAFEETGFAPPAGTTAEPLGYDFFFENRWGRFHEHVFALNVAGVAPPRLDAREHDGCRWVEPREAETLLRFPSNLEGLRRLAQAKLQLWLT